MLSFESEKTQALQSNVILYQVNMSWKPLSNGSVAILLITKLTKASYFGLIKDLYRKEDTQDRKKFFFLLILVISTFVYSFVSFLFFNGISRLYGKEKLKRLFYLEDFLNSLRINQERSSRMIWELVLLYACFCY